MAEGNIAVASWLQRLAPDVAATTRRFPFAILLAAFATATFLAASNVDQWLDEEGWIRLFIGFATGAVCAVAGVFFSESRPDARRLGIILTYVLPAAVVAACQFRDTGWIAPFTLPVVSILWLSVSGFTRFERGETREEQQHRFWWINQRAIATAALAGLAFLAIAAGVVAIERSLGVLFGIESGDLFYRWVLPVVGLFLTPVYWLSTLPAVADYDSADMEQPDFIAGAVGFLGQFVLVPLLLIYTAILLVYTVQIVVTRSLPQGTIGWMVLGFVVAGAATWLVLHPPFMQTRGFVRLFRRYWWWLTLVPLALFAVAVWVRVDAYGLTSERMFLIAGGVWATVLAILFLVGRGDIRIIPALAGAILLLFSIGPWNYINLPLQNQVLRLDLLVMDAGNDKSLSPPRPDWSDEEIAEARGILDYLAGTNEGRRRVREVMSRYGVTWPTDRDGSNVVLEALGVPQARIVPGTDTYLTVTRAADATVNVSATPELMGTYAFHAGSPVDIGSMRLRLHDDNLVATPATETPAVEDQVLADLSAWVASQRPGEPMRDPAIDFTYGGVNYRFVVSQADVVRLVSDGKPKIVSVTGQLFRQASAGQGPVLESPTP